MLLCKGVVEGIYLFIFVCCDVFYYCVYGIVYVNRCLNGLVFDVVYSICVLEMIICIIVR